MIGWLLLLAGWTALWWSRSTAIWIVGLLVLVLGHSAFLAVEFVAGQRVGANDPTPRASAWQVIRAWLAETWAAPRVFVWQQPFRWHAQPDHLPPRASSKRGVVLIHGLLCNRAFWNPWLGRLRADDRAFVAVDLEPVFGSIDRYVQIVEQAVRRVTEATGLPPVLICHSMGGLAARAWLREAEGARVHRIVTIGTPHHGTWLAQFGRSANGREMRIGSEWIRRIESEPASVQRVAFTCWYSNCDNIVFPPSVATLPGADNRLVAGLGHVEMAYDASLREATLALIDT